MSYAIRLYRVLLVLIVSLVIASCMSDQTIYSFNSDARGEYDPYPPVYTRDVPPYSSTDVGTLTPEDVPFEGKVWIDSFIQPASTEGVDILWVIDRSCSMNDNEPQLLSGIGAMISALPPSGWRLNIVSAAPPNAANDSQFPLVPGDDVDDALDLINNMSNGGLERGFDSAHAYLESNSYANTWMREDATLLVVFVSDEDDQSIVLPQVSDFTSWYGVQRMGSVFLASIVHIPGSPLCNVSPHFAGDRYIDATTYFGGVIVDICAEDWSPGVQDASAQVQPFEDWLLTHVPDPEDSVVVFVDGSPYPDWVYDPVSNLVEFLVIPGAGALVEIGYVYDPWS